MKNFRNAIPFLILFFSICALWELLVHFHILPESLFPPPSYVWQALKESPQEWWTAFKDTGTHSLIGLFLSLLLGGILSLVLSLSQPLKRAFLPLSLFFQTVPIIAIAPLLVIYFGFGAPTVIASSTLVSFFPVMASFLLGLESIEKEKLELFHLYGANSLQTLFKLRLPHAFLALYSGLKIAVGLSVVGTVAGEFVGGSGLGALIDAARTAQRVDRVFGALLLLALLGILYLTILRLTFTGLRRIRPFGPESQEWS